MDIELGTKVKCKLTGFIGIAVARTEFINGCVQYIVLAKFKKKELPLEMSIDETSLEIIKSVKKKKKRETGGYGRNY